MGMVGWASVGVVDVEIAGMSFAMPALGRPGRRA